MKITDDSFAVLLLTLSLSADREEYVRPLSGQEYARLREKLRVLYLRPGRLLGMDISGLMQALSVEEKEAYRLFVLLHRDVQVSYLMENLSRLGIGVVSCEDLEYPKKLSLRAGEAAPPFFYSAGNVRLREGHLIGIYGANGVKTADPERKAAEEITDFARGFGYGVCLTGETGIAHYASELARARGIATLTVLGGDLMRFKDAHPESGAVSPVHPEALSTAAHIAERNRMFFSLCDAVFILNTDGRHSESEAVMRGYCRNVYFLSGGSSAASPLSGASAFSSFDAGTLTELSSRWHEEDYTQISIFDL